jgi:hypothetical protein
LLSDEYHHTISYILKDNLCENEKYHNFTSQEECEKFENGAAKEVIKRNFH